jgi:hypothetical protein
MTADELADFLAQAPAGAICTDDGGRLTALPAQLTQCASRAIELAVTGVAADAVARAEVRACLVADTFTAYRDIRGVIAQGTIMWPPSRDDLAELKVGRMTTFSFANS